MSRRKGKKVKEKEVTRNVACLFEKRITNDKVERKRKGGEWRGGERETDGEKERQTERKRDRQRERETDREKKYDENQNKMKD